MIALCAVWSSGDPALHDRRDFPADCLVIDRATHISLRRSHIYHRIELQEIIAAQIGVEVDPPLKQDEIQSVNVILRRWLERGYRERRKYWYYQFFHQEFRVVRKKSCLWQTS